MAPRTQCVGTVSDVEVRSLSREPGPSGHSPSFANAPLPSGSLQGGGEERKEGESDSWGWGWGRVGRSPLQKPLVNLEAGMLSFLANWGIVWRGKSQRACRGPESTVGKSVGPVSIRLSHFLAEFLGGQLPAFSEAFLYA